VSALGDVLRAIAKHLPAATEEILKDIDDKIVALEPISRPRRNRPRSRRRRHTR